MTFQRIIRVKNCEITRRDSNFSQTFPHFHCQHTSAQRKMRSIYSNEPAVFGWFRGHWSLLCKRTHHRFWNLKTKQSINRRAAVEWRSGDSPVVRHDANAHFSTVWCCNLLNTTCNFVKRRADFPFHWAADGPTNHIFPFTANAKIGIYFKHNTALDDGTDLQATEFTARIFFFTQKTDRETSPGRTPVCDWGGTGWPLLLLLAAGRPTQLTQKMQTPVPLVSVAYLTVNLSLFCVTCPHCAPSSAPQTSFPTQQMALNDVEGFISFDSIGHLLINSRMISVPFWVKWRRIFELFNFKSIKFVTFVEILS